MVTMRAKRVASLTLPLVLVIISALMTLSRESRAGNLLMKHWDTHGHVEGMKSDVKLVKDKGGDIGTSIESLESQIDGLTLSSLSAEGRGNDPDKQSDKGQGGSSSEVGGRDKGQDGFLDFSASQVGGPMEMLKTAVAGPHFEDSFQTLEEVCKVVEIDFYKTVVRHCESPTTDILAATHLSKCTYTPIRTLYTTMTSQAFGFTIETHKKTGGDNWSLYASSTAASASTPFVDASHVVHNARLQTAGRVVDHWNGSYDVFIELPALENNSWELNLTHDYQACSGYRVNWPANRQSEFLGKLAASFILSTTPDAASSIPIAPPPATPSTVSPFLSSLGYWQSNRFVAPPSHIGQCSRLPPKDLRLKKDIMIAGDSTFGQLDRCFFGRVHESKAQQAQEAQELKMDPCFLARNAMKHPHEPPQPTLEAWAKLVNDHNTCPVGETISTDNSVSTHSIHGHASCFAQDAHLANPTLVSISQQSTA